MKHLKIFENFNNSKEIEELIEDIFVEIFDKWEIKQIPDEVEEQSEFMANLDSEDLYWDIRVSSTNIMLEIKQNVFDTSSLERFNNLVRDCQPTLKRLQKYSLNIDWNNQTILNPYNFGRLVYFRVVVHLNK